ncbi:hypothetical protein N8I74_18195 [Chitiniphilus purpureus]|uniref:PilN domain-containing protein n=1 Tax=Chitiniphilus purpureus TaxID=2981137 RepID=A0ABY6DNG7_9NEIS|nr:hypothetical protein [Chitiniphilus sp. CD1]UXY15218.1 hypothetical protein N8I74_18195 [Chitiniphilus sp. CD1]
MSSAEARIYLHADGVRWRDAGAGADEALDLPAGLRLPAPAAVDALPALLAPIWQGLRARRVRVLLAANLLQWFSLPWSRALLDAHGAQVQCRLRLLDLLGEARAAAALCRVAPIAFGQPAGAACLDRALFDLLADGAARHGKQLQGVRVLAVDAWRRVRGQVSEARYGCAVVEPGALTLFVAEGGSLRQVFAQAWHDDWAEALSLLWHRVQVRGLPAMPLHVLPLVHSGPLPPLPGQPLRWPGTASLLDGPAGTGWPEFAAAKRGALPGRVLLGAGALAVLAAGFGLWQAQTEAAAAQAALAAAAPRAAVPGPQLTELQRTQLRQQVAAVNRLVAQLNLPYPALMAALTPAPDSRVALRDIQIRQSGAGAQIRIAASGRDTEAMTAYYARLLAHPRLRQVQLSKHALVTDAATPQFEFELEALWQ